MKLPWLNPSQPFFPDTADALSEPNGLLAAGGALSVDWLLKAYSQGIFPWFNDGDPILWWTPSPRMVIYPHQFHISRSLKKALKKGGYQVTINRDFAGVIQQCAALRETLPDSPGTWITPVMSKSYIDFHLNGYAHSVEVWHDQQLVGGLYGIALGKVFFGESMFSKATNGSKIAIAHLVEYLKEWQYKLIDCQVYNDHLSRLGAIEIERQTFEQMIDRYVGSGTLQTNREPWAPQDITLPASYWTKPL